MTDNALSRPFLLLLLLLQGLAHTATVHACTPQTFPTQGALSPVTLQSRVLDVVWPTSKRVPPNGTDSRTSKSAFALVADLDGFPGGGLWRSGDEGRSWKDESAALRSSLPPGADETTHVGITSIVWHDSNPQRLFLLGRGRFHWTSDDGGATYRGVATPGNTVGLGQVIRPHPRQPDWLMANVRRDACLIDPRSPLCALDLFISKDWGGSWTNLTEASGGKITGFRDFDWAAKLEHEEHEDGGKEKYKGKNLPDEAVLATAYLSQGSHGHRGLTPGWDADLHFVVTLDLFASPFAAVIACGNQFEIIAGKIFLAVPSECPVGPDGTPRTPGSGTIRSRSVTLYVSDRDSGATGDRWTTERLGKFVEACLPARLEDDGYTLIHTHDNKAAFVLADHAEPGSWGPLTDSPTSDAYAPAYAASLHTLSLPGVYRRDFVTDFTRVEGIPGAYVANQLDPTATAGGASRGKEASFLRTRLTLGGGGRWAAIRSPQSFRYGHCNACPSDSESCFLHLHGSTSWFASQGPHPGWYSLPTAPGLVLATGNVGPHLDMSPDADCTWMSRDGGVTWEDVADDTAIYEVGNHGGVVVMARHASEGPTNVIKFSIDDGECFHEVKLPEAVLIENIRVAPGGESTVFVAHGTACLKTDLRPECSFTGGSRPPGKMYVIDLKTLLSDSSLGWKLCDLSSDYERWSPLASECLLGMEHTFWRRKRGVACINPPNHLKTLEERFGMMTDGDHRDVNDDRKKNCICDADQDFECEFGFARDENGTCVQISGVTVEEACPVSHHHKCVVCDTL